MTTPPPRSIVGPMYTGRGRRPVEGPAPDGVVRVVLVMHVEHVPLLPPPGAVPPPTLVTRGPFPRIPHVHEITPREFGLRVGVWRMLEILRPLGASFSAAVDTFCVSRHPALVEALVDAGADIMGHGRDGATMQHEDMPVEEERRIVADNLEALRLVSPQAAFGWAGVENMESSSTLDLLQELSVPFVVDWSDDDVPYWVPGGEGDLLSIPVATYLDVAVATRLYNRSLAEWTENVATAVEVLAGEAGGQQRVLALNLHPWLLGHPYALGHFRRLVERLLSTRRCRVVTAAQVHEEWSTARRGAD